MDTLYDLLGALPHDDAEGLRVAFRRAVKGAHPDIRPGDPDAALKFRQIVRANEILGDTEQRAAYDHLLALAHLEKRLASAQHPIAAKVHRVASGVMTLAGSSIVTLGGYLLFMHMSAAVVAPSNNTDVMTRVSTSLAAVTRADSPGPTSERASFAKTESTIPHEMIVPSVIPVINVESIPPLHAGASADPAPNDAGFFRARGISAYRYGDLNAAITDLDQAIQIDPKFSAAYIDRGIVLYRMRKFDRAFADIARAKRIEKQSHPKSTPATAAKSRPDQAGTAPAATPLPPRRTTAHISLPADWPTSTFQ